MKLISRLLIVATAAVLPFGAVANERYGEPRAIIVSPDLSAPWVMQLQKVPVRKMKRKLMQPLPTQETIIIGTSVSRVKTVKRNVPQPVYNSGVVRIDNDGRMLTEQVAYAKPKKLVPRREIDPMFLPQDVSYSGSEKPGTIVIETSERFLYLVQSGGTARRYGVGVGKPGFEWAGKHKISRKAEWPSWTPPEEMKVRVRLKEGRILPDFMEGGPENPLGARAMYLGNSLYRIHGTNQPWTIGQNVSSGCIRMRNEDVTDLYERVGVGTLVIVR
ncbi:MAG: L,D-transpeptidase [Rhizobiaceae bacterium]